jgi:hypothetical protein
MLLSGVVAAISITPILDRILTRHVGITRLLFPFIGGSWLSLIWAGKEGSYTHFPSFGDLTQLIYSEVKQHCGAFRHLCRHWGVLDTLFYRWDRAQCHTD